MADDMVMTDVFADVECNLGEIGGDNGVDETLMSDISDRQKNNSHEHPSRNATLQIIISSITLH
jgi:hypothetical protein